MKWQSVHNSDIQFCILENILEATLNALFGLLLGYNKELEQKKKSQGRLEVLRKEPEGREM